MKKTSSALMPIYLLTLLLAINYAATNTKAAADMDADKKITLITPNIKKIFTLNELKSKLEVVTVKIHDPVYNKEKSFDGFKLNEVLKLVDQTAENIADHSDEIIFTTSDGSAPTISVMKAKSHNAILTFKEHSSDGFEKVSQGKSMLDPGPFYLIWTDADSTEEFPWPYQLSSIELVVFDKKFPKIIPSGIAANSAEMRGFKTFKGMCIRCHSINLQGGELAPELNIPKNITDYWSAKTLKEFIHDAPSFRLKSKMPTFKKILTTKQIDEVIAYLKTMKLKKIY